MSQTSKLTELRDQIDALDAQILKLISERARCAQEVASVKMSEDGDDAVFYRPEREAQVLRAVMDANQGPLSDEEIARLFREVMSACLALEQPTQVAYLGPEGTFTQQAALKHFGHSSVAKPVSTIDQVFREVEAGAVNYGVVPVENSTEGVVSHTLDTFMNSNLNIVGEVELRIHHNLMISSNTDPKKITRIYSHSQTLAQCRAWLDENYPGAELVSLSSNAEAAKRVRGEWNSAAIAGDVASDIYDLEILAEKIEDRPDNTTRFLIVGSETTQPSGNDKTSIMLRTRNKPGALYELLKPFREQAVDLTRLETRPSKSENWNYVFFLDFKGHSEDASVKQVFESLDGAALDIKVLGSYPIAVL